MSKPSDTMVASVLSAPHEIRLTQVPTPAPGPGEVLVRVTAVGVCGSDTHFYETGHVGDIVVRGPLILGHETAGVVAAVGAGVEEGMVGARVAVEPQTPCRACESCKTGRYHLCPRIRFFGAWPVNGSFAEYAIVDDDFAHVVPDTMSDEEAALVEPVSVAVHAARRAGVTAGSTVLIAGAGPIGLLTLQVARAFGATEVVVSDPIPHRREFALQHGASAVLDPTLSDRIGDELFDVFIDASGHPGAILAALPAIKRGGLAVLVGMGGDELTVPIAMLQHREITLTGTFRYANTWPAAIALISAGRIDVSDLVTARYGLDEVEAALTKGKTDPHAIKTMIVPALTPGIAAE